ncbi:MAG: ABC transporter permease [Alphaproteobacteria bacterium]|nr:ABC transporter permease [Alphaproteobacteria bacterium]
MIVSHSFSLMRLIAFMYKEAIQIVRDPSTIMIAFILPLLMLFLFGYGVSLDANQIRIGLVLEDTSPEARSLGYAFEKCTYFQTKVGINRKEIEDDLTSGRIRGMVVIPSDFSVNLLKNQPAFLQVIADGSETNTASFVENYADGVIEDWLEKDLGKNAQIIAETRVWYNSELKSRNVLLPGSISVIMSLIGTLLTALVVAREWERGTMEAIMSTPILISELILGKLLPYFILGMVSMVICVASAAFVFDVPFVGSLFVLFLATAVFLLAALSQGLLISIMARNQFVASQTALNVAFLPAFMLSGFLYEITSMPVVLQWITHLLPARYFVSIIQSSFLAGTIWPQIIPNLLAMSCIAGFFLFLVVKKSVKRLD